MRKLFYKGSVLVFFLLSSLLQALPVRAESTIPLTVLGSPYYQDFNALSSTGESNILPPGWVLLESRVNANNLYSSSKGNITAGDTYSFGLENSTERALGGIQASNLLPLFGASFTNQTGGIITSIEVNYTGEEWRFSKLTRSDKLIFEYSSDATTLENGTWSRYEDLNFITPYTSVVGARNGNDPVNRKIITYTISGLSIEPGQSFWVRWIDYDALGDDDGLAVDDFYLTPFGSDFSPSLSSVSPGDNTTQVALDANISIVFNEPVNLSEGWFSLTCTNSNQHLVSVTGGPQAFIVNPEVDFDNGDNCSITILASKVSDQDSTDPPDYLDKDYSFIFSTIPMPDSAPIITNTSPANNENDVLIDSYLSVRFSEPVTVTPDWYSLNCVTSGSHIVAAEGGPTLYILTPQKMFTYDEICTLNIYADKISDQDADDPPDSMASDFTTTFTTISSSDTAPFIAASKPANNATDIAVTQNLELTFSEPVLLDNEAVELICESGESLSLTVSGGPITFILNPDSALNYSDQCSLTVDSQKVTDLDFLDPPNNMLIDQSVSFSTEANPDSAPSVKETSPETGTTNIALNSSISISFNEDVSTSENWAQLVCSSSGNHTFITTGNSHSRTIIPNVPFTHNESCSLSLLANQIHDLDEIDPPDELDEDFVLTFSTASPTDLSPKVIETFPENSAVDVPVDTDFSVTFSEAITALFGWINVECSKSDSISVSLHNGPIKFNFGQDHNFNYSEICRITFVANRIIDQDSNDPPDFMEKDYTFSFTTEKSPDEITPPTIIMDGNSTPYNDQILNVGTSHLFVQFSKDVLHDGSGDAADNKNNYQLIERGENLNFDTTSCHQPDADDQTIAIDSVAYDAITFKADLAVNYGVNLPDGVYRLFICGDHTIRDLYGNPLNNGMNSTITFIIRTTGNESEPTEVATPPGSGSGSGGDPGTSETSTDNGDNQLADVLPKTNPFIPVTGFQPGTMTILGPQTIAYKALSEQWLEIPSMELKISIVGVPQEEGQWDVTWLGSQAGYLEGSALPGLPGNSVLTAHVWDAINRPGPFYGLEDLGYGDQVIVHAWGSQYIYEVREVLSVKPNNVKAMMKHQEKTWLTLVTCQGFEEESGEYQRRVLVRAVLVKVI